MDDDGNLNMKSHPHVAFFDRGGGLWRLEVTVSWGDDSRKLEAVCARSAIAGRRTDGSCMVKDSRRLRARPVSLIFRFDECWLAEKDDGEPI